MPCPLDGKRLAVIGDPIGHSLSPAIHQAMLGALGSDCSYGLIRVPAGRTAEWLASVEARGLAGFNATMPHKTGLVPLMTTLSDDARLCRAVNTVVLRGGEFHGHNTDGEGFLRSLLERDLSPEGQDVAVLGAGGAARAVVLKLARSGARSITVCCRHPEKAAELAKASPLVRTSDLSRKSTDAVLSAASMLINATPLGMTGFGADFADFAFLDALPRPSPVCDLVYRPQETGLLREAAGRGHPTMNGLGMLIHQAILALGLFGGFEPDERAMASAVREKLLPLLAQD